MRQKTIHRLFIMEFFAQAVAVFSLLPIMFSERGGLSPLQVGSVLAVLSVSAIIAEIPTGAIADKYSRKWSLFFSKLVLLCGLLVMYLFPGYAGYLVGMTLLGIAESMSSGALQAYLYEELGENKKDFAHYNSRLWVVIMGGFILGSAIASLVGPQYTFLLISSIVTTTISVFVAFSLKSDSPKTDDHESHSIVKNTASAIAYICKSKLLLYATGSILLMKLLVDVLIEYIPLFYKNSGTPTRVVPILFFVGNCITIALFWYSKKLTKLLHKKELVTGFTFLLLLAGSAYLNGAYAVLGMFWYVRFARLLFIHKEGEIQHLYVNKYRATIASAYSMGARLLSGICLVVIGRFSTQNRGIVLPIIVFVAITYSMYAALTKKSRSLAVTQNIEL